MRRLTLLVIAAAAALGACEGTYQAQGTLVTSAPAPTPINDTYDPDLVYVSPGVSVIADYDEPVFYSNNFYWRYYGGRWYRSSQHNRGWVYYSSPPTTITRIDRPYAYRHYRPHGYTVRRDRGRTYDNRTRPVHDHRY